MDGFEKYYNRALRFLSFRPRSEKEIRDNLQKKKASPPVIEKIINKLKDKNFLNDEEFTKWWIESRLRFRLRSIHAIKKELFQKGITKELIDAQISNFHPPAGGSISNELENAQKLIEKKIKQYKNLPRNKLYQKLGGFLARRGFDYETIKQSIDELLRKGV